ncbi:hypothetical protein ACWD3J_14250 [Streptomyces sp. NPDC002755]
MRAFYRGYSTATGRRAKQVRRLHVMREDGNFAGKQGMCGAPGWGVTQSPPVILEPLPAEPPAGLSWCSPCIGHAAHLVGQLETVARTIADLAEATCGRCRQQRKLFPFSWMPNGWMEFKTIQLCARCHSLSALEDEDDQLDSTPLLNAIGAYR